MARIETGPTVAHLLESIKIAPLAEVSHHGAPNEARSAAEAGSRPEADRSHLQPANVAKILALYSARNRVKVDRRALFDAGAATASVWYDAFCEIYRSGLVEEQVVENLREHYTFDDPRLAPTHEVQELYFGSTY